MPPKKAKKGKKGKKGKKKINLDPNALTAVDKAFYDLTITDLNRKLARLRTLTEDLERKNQELNEQKEKLNEDKSDIISYLKRVLQEKTDEMKELEERIVALQETRMNEVKEFEEKITEWENEYKQMREQLVSENKLFAGKLNSLEEFRIQRDDLMKKFEDQETAMHQQQKQHTREMYEIERSAIIAKDNLVKNMESRLVQLSTEFHDSLDLRVSATTQKVIQENITINRELNRMLTIHQQLYKEHQNLKEQHNELRRQAELLEMERKKILSNVEIQKKIINRLTVKNEDLHQNLSKFKHHEIAVKKSKIDIESYIEKNKQMDYKMKLLEQNLHRIKCENHSLKTELIHLKEDNSRLDEILFEAVNYIKHALTINSTTESLSLKTTKRESFLHTLLTLLSEGHDKIKRQPSLDTVSSANAAYAQGDLGFIPKSTTDLRPLVTVKRHISTQIDDSFDEYLSGKDFSWKKQYSYRSDDDSEFLGELDVLGVQEEEQIEAHEMSDVYFDETEMEVEEDSDEDDRDEAVDILAVEFASISTKSDDEELLRDDNQSKSEVLPEEAEGIQENGESKEKSKR